MKYLASPVKFLVSLTFYLRFVLFLPYFSPVNVEFLHLTQVGSYQKNMEKLKINFKRKKATGEFTMLIGKDGDYFVSKIPSLNLSSFGDTEEEAKTFMKHALDDYFETMFEGTEENLVRDLQSVGFERDVFFNKRFQQKELSPSFIDGDGTLQGFDDPKSVKQEKITI